MGDSGPPTNYQSGWLGDSRNTVHSPRRTRKSSGEGLGRVRVFLNRRLDDLLGRWCLHQTLEQIVHSALRLASLKHCELGPRDGQRADDRCRHCRIWLFIDQGGAARRSVASRVFASLRGRCATGKLTAGHQPAAVWCTVTRWCSRASGLLR